MSEQVKDALKKLDVSNDNHWTADKLPRLETVRLMAGDQSISREDVDAAAPGFSKDTAAAYWLTVPETPAQAATGPNGGESTEGQGVSTAPQPGGAGAAPQAAEEAEGASEESEGSDGDASTGDTEGETEQPEVEGPVDLPDENDLEALEAALAETQSDLDELRVLRAEVDRRLEAGYRQEQTLTERIEKLQPRTNKQAPVIQDYLASQKRELEKRRARKDLIASSGLDLKELAKDLKSPIDAAMARRTGRGGQRPSRI